MNKKDEALRLTLERINLHLAHHEHGCVYLDDALVARIHEALAEQVGINGLTESETAATASVMGLVNREKPKKEPSAFRSYYNDWRNP